MPAPRGMGRHEGRLEAETGEGLARLEPPILRPGYNCWRIGHARRAAFLIDGAAYYAAFRAAAVRARRSIFIVGWDVDSRTLLPPADGEEGGLPVSLGKFLNALIQRRADLRVHVLDWDFAMLYALDREVLPLYQSDWRSQRRLRFHLDDRHPVGASHHQKIVVIDDVLAFVGGLDLTHERWDTPDHDPVAPRRVDADGKPYAPFHDLQWMLEGEAAGMLAQLARERWRRATDRPARTGRAPAGDPWPPSVKADLADVEIAVARTEPAYNGNSQVEEIKRLYLDAIAAARRHIYIENQYFTATSVGDALAARLREPSGPDVVVVSRRRGDGWLEANTMEVLRARLLDRLREADAHNRLRVCYPDRDGLDTQQIKVHSKLMIVDGCFLRIGSANLNNRSMGLDTECDLAVEARRPAEEQAIAGLRNRLLAEHLGVEPARVEKEIGRSASLIAAMDALGGHTRRLVPLAAEVPPEVDALVPEAGLIDPERPIDPEQLANELVPPDSDGHAGHRVVAIAALLLTVVALAAAWRWTPLSQWVDVRTLVHTGEELGTTPSAGLWVLAAYVLASVLVFPITLLVVATVFLFGPVRGFAYALAGAILGAGLTFWLGQALGRNVVRRMAVYGPLLVCQHSVL